LVNVELGRRPDRVIEARLIGEIQHMLNETGADLALLELR
jgi:hypothetical protein